MIKTIHVTPIAHMQARALGLSVPHLKAAVHHRLGHRENADRTLHLVLAIASCGTAYSVFYSHPTPDETLAVVCLVLA